MDFRLKQKILSYLIYTYKCLASRYNSPMTIVKWLLRQCIIIRRISGFYMNIEFDSWFIKTDYLQNYLSQTFAKMCA